METLATLTPTDIQNGVLQHILANAGISDVQQYVNDFHRETENLILEDFENSTSDEDITDEQIVPPADIRDWLNRLHPHLDDPAQPAAPELREILPPPSSVSIVPEKPSAPKDLSGWLGGFRPPLDENAAAAVPSVPEVAPSPPPPTNLSSWMQRLAPDRLSGTFDTNSSSPIEVPATTPVVSGDLGSWLHNWSVNIAQQPPPTSLDTWLQSLVSTNLNEPMGKATSAKGRLNSYLNAAQEVLSQHGYKVSGNEIKSPSIPEEKTGLFGNVKQMYFVWKTLDKNHDRKITVEDVQILLQEMGLGFLSKYLAETIFDMVDTNHDGSLQFRDFIAFMSIIKQLMSAAKSVKA